MEVLSERAHECELLTGEYKEQRKFKVWPYRVILAVICQGRSRVLLVTSSKNQGSDSSIKRMHHLFKVEYYLLTKDLTILFQ